MLEFASAQRIGALLAESSDAPPGAAARPLGAATLYLTLFLATILHASAVTGSLVAPRKRLAGADSTTQRQDGQEDPRMEFTQKLGAAAGAVALSIGGGALAQDAVQWRVEDGGNGHWYAVVPNASEHRSWDQCQAFCQAHGSNLACISSADENSWIANFALQYEWAWVSHPDGFGPLLGGRQVQGSGEPVGLWGWVSGEAWNYSNWNPGEPNNSGCGSPDGEAVLAFTARSAVWNDLNPNPASCVGWLAPSFIAEWSADCNNDGVVDYGQIRAGQLPDANADGVPDGCETNTGGHYSAIQWTTAEGGNGHWYQAHVVSQGIGWSAANQLALQLGGSLACAESAPEKFYFFARFSPAAVPDAWVQQAPGSELNFGPWLGGAQQPGSKEPLGGWTWVSGVPFDPTELGCCNNDGCAGSEDRLHLMFYQGAVTWNDLPDTWSCGAMPRSLMIEWSADCNNDGVVDFGQILTGELVDANHNNIPDCCEGAGACNCPGDVARDGVVNGIDLAAVLNNWGTTGGVINADANHDGTVDASDLAIVLSGWGACP